MVVWGVALVLAGLVLHVAIGVGHDWLPRELADSASWTDAFAAIYDVATVQLALGANALILVGVVTLAGTWLLGASRPATNTRRRAAPGLRDHALLAWLGWAIVLFGAIRLVPALASRSPEGIVLVIALAAVGFWALRREIVREQVPTLAPVAMPAPEPTMVEAPAPDLDARLARLEDLHARGVIDDDEFEAATQVARDRAASLQRREEPTEPVAPGE
jgi:hypothetical protein